MAQSFINFSTRALVGLHVGPLARRPAWSLSRSNGRLLTVSPDVQNADSVVFGFQIPWLTDILSDPLYNADGFEGITQKLLTQWTAAIRAAWSLQSYAISLRFLWDPQQGSVVLGLLCRVTAPRHEIVPAVEARADALDHWFKAANVPLMPINKEEDLQKLLGNKLLSYVCEVRQKEALLPLHLHHEICDAYVVYPYLRPQGSWIELFRSLVHKRGRLLVNLHIETTHILSAERNDMMRATQIAKELSDFQYSGLSGNLRIQDHNSKIVYRLYSTLAQRLEHPFLAAAQVVGESAAEVREFAGRLGGTIVPPSLQEDNAQEAELPSGFHIAEGTLDQDSGAQTTLRSLWLGDWGHSQATEGKSRLRFLVDARGAASVFRLPIPNETGLPGVDVRKIQPGYESGRRVVDRPDNSILLGTQNNGSMLTLPVRDLARHALICGTTGSGKTNTMLGILTQLWRDHRIPFWVLEPPKTEYRGLLRIPGFESSLIFTVGDEGTAPLRLNPFELLPGVTVEQHINNLKTCFEVGLPKIDDSGSLLPMFIEGAIRDIYKQRQWRSTDKHVAGREIPTMNDLLTAAQRALGSYAGEVKQNLTAAVSNRIKSLLRGSKGRMFNVERGASFEGLLRRPVVFELLPMGDDAPLVLMFLLTFLREHAQRREEEHLQHLTVIEEAHVIMAQAEGPRAGNAAAGVARAFENILAELRSAGEGVLIAEQSPTKLIKGAIDLTNLKIVHRLAGPEEIAIVGGAMTATPVQKDAVQRLTAGQAAVFMEGMQGLTFMQAPDFKSLEKYQSRLREEAVSSWMEPYYQENPKQRLPFHGCTFCESVCRYHDDVEGALASDSRRRNAVAAAASARTKVRTEKPNDVAACTQADRAFCGSLGVIGAGAGHAGSADAAWCAWVQMVDEDFIFQREQRREFLQEFANLIDREKRK